MLPNKTFRGAKEDNYWSLSGKMCAALKTS